MNSGGGSDSATPRSKGSWDGVDMDKFDQDTRAELANRDLTAATNGPQPSLWDQITEKGKSILDATGQVLNDVLGGRAMLAADNQAVADERAMRRFQAQLAADNLANGWVDDGLSMRKIGPVASALGPEQMMPGRENSVEQVLARSLNEGMQLAAADALMAPVLTKISRGLSSFLSEEAKLNYGLTQEIRASPSADLRMPTGMSGLSPQMLAEQTLDVGVRWGSGIQAQGLPWENYLAGQLPTASRLPAGFKTFDFFDDISGTAISAKTIDTSTPAKLAKPQQIYGSLKANIDAASRFESYTLKGVSLSADDIAVRQLQVAIPHTATAAQLQQIQRAVQYGQSNGVQVIVLR